MRIVGLDLSLTGTGAAFVSTDGDETIGLVKTTDKQGNKIDRCLLIASTLRRSFLKECDMVFIEDYAYGSKAGANSLAYLGELNGIVKAMVLSHLGRHAETVAIGTWKKFLCNKGSLNKDEFKMQCLKKFGVELSSNDEAAALAIADFGMAVMTGKGIRNRQLIGYEQDVLKKYKLCLLS
jgi:hypothetical protein